MCSKEREQISYDNIATVHNESMLRELAYIAELTQRFMPDTPLLLPLPLSLWHCRTAPRHLIFLVSSDVRISPSLSPLGRPAQRPAPRAGLSPLGSKLFLPVKYEQLRD